MIIGYTQGTFDTLHYGHVRLLKNAKKYCDYLIVGINSDRLVKEYKKQTTIIKEKQRAEIVKIIKYVDEVHIVNSLDKISKVKKFKFQIIFIGDDWKNSKRWIIDKNKLSNLGIKVKFLKHTDGISTSYIRSKII